MREPEADTPLGWLASLLDLKRKVIEELTSIVGSEGVSRAKGDHHSFRKPRPCGITIHTGRGCTNQCLYCYARDMGFPSIDAPYHLKPEELSLAIALNPFVIPYRTFAAFGSVAEPFLPNTVAYSAKCIMLIHKYLKLPCQVATKMVLSDEIIDALIKGDSNLSLLVTVVTLSKHKVLEPKAPHPIERLYSARRALERGLKVTIFLRPLIPGIIEREYERLLRLVKDMGINTLVVGSLRVTKGIIERLKSAGIEVSEILSRLPREPRGAREQVTVRCSDIKKLVVAKARELGLTVFESACQANVWSHNQYCAACDLGPCGSYSSEPRFTENDVNEFLEAMGARAKCELLTRTCVVIKGKISSNQVEIVKQATRRIIVIE